MKKKNFARRSIVKPLIGLLLALCIFTVNCGYLYAEEEAYEENSDQSDSDEEEEFIPEEYYDPIQSNEITGWPQGPAVQAAGAVIMDLDSGAFLYSKNAYAAMYPASITKIMTALVVLENCSNLDEEITFSEIVYDIEEDSSHAGIKPGEKMTVRQALYALMLESANDAANGLAEYTAGGISQFADLMNQKAEELGCVNTHFVNPHGLHNENHYTCAFDMALIAQAAYQNEEFRTLCSTTVESCPPTNETEEERYFYNHHKMLQSDSENYYPYCTGGKTGFTSDAWNTLVTFSEQDGMRLVCVLLHENGAQRAYDETKALFGYGYANFQLVTITPQISDKTVYEAMKLNYVGDIAPYVQAEALKQKIAEVVQNGIVTIPRTITINELTSKLSNDDLKNGVIDYSYNDWTVGKAKIKVNPFVVDVPLPYEKKVDVNYVIQESGTDKKLKEIEATAEMVMNRADHFIRSTYAKAEDFVKENTLLVICIGSVILVFLFLLIFILVIRCTRESRMQKRRKQEERVLLKRAEEIELKTTAEIEEELRNAMEQEKIEKEKKEMKRQERLKQRQQQEALLKETEDIIKEINETDKKGR